MMLKKSFGQVFLNNKNYITRIVNHLEIEGQTVVEIGPGDGRISRMLLPRLRHLYCIEVDRKLAERLNKELLSPCLSVINGDILKFDLYKIGEKVVVFGNIPFQISSALIRYLVKNRGVIKKAYLTFQKEFARRLVASKGTKEYSFLSCYFQYYAEGKIVFDIPRRAFYPSPRVDASFVEIEFFKDSPWKVNDERILFEILRKVFSARRKKIINAMAGLFPFEVTREALLAAGIEESLRPENVSLKEYCVLTNELLKYTGRIK